MARISVLLFIILICPNAWAQQFALVTFNPDIDQLRLNQVKMLYRGRLQHVNGLSVRLMDFPRDSNHRTKFYLTLLKKSPSQMNAIWARQSFSGKAIVPVEIENESPATIRQWLENNQNGIAYVPLNLVPEEGNVIFISQ